MLNKNNSVYTRQSSVETNKKYKQIKKKFLLLLWVKKMNKCELRQKCKSAN